MTRDSLGDRMKNNYENRAKTYLTRRTPVCIRIDGKAHHSFTKGLKKPYDEIYHKAMHSMMKYLCENIQGCKLAYTQSDECTFILTDYDTLTTNAWFDYNVQKICSVSASMATIAFNKAFRFYANEWFDNLKVRTEQDIKYYEILESKFDNSMFDARCFNIPKEEVTNCILWRQQDATRNAIQMLGQCNFSHKELQDRSCNDIQDMLMLQKGINFNDMPIEFKRGVCCVKKEIECTDRLIGYKLDWVIDKEIPIFTQDRDYIENTFKIKEQ